MFSNRIRQALGSSRTGDEPDLHLGQAKGRACGREDEVTLLLQDASQTTRSLIWSVKERAGTGYHLPSERVRSPRRAKGCVSRRRAGGVADEAVDGVN